MYRFHRDTCVKFFIVTRDRQIVNPDSRKYCQFSIIKMSSSIRIRSRSNSRRSYDNWRIYWDDRFLFRFFFFFFFFFFFPHVIFSIIWLHFRELYRSFSLRQCQIKTSCHSESTTLLWNSFVFHLICVRSSWQNICFQHIGKLQFAIFKLHDQYESILINVCPRNTDFKRINDETICLRGRRRRFSRWIVKYVKWSWRTKWRDYTSECRRNWMSTEYT